jgi:hypothetical protein
MQAAEKLVTNSIEELIKKNAKLERVAELASQLIETYGDEFASYNEKQYVLEKLGESIQEYELFLED